MSAEKGYRPTTLDEFCGQDDTKMLIKVSIAAAKMKEECLDHILISGPSGCGKTTLANIIANEMGVDQLRVYSGPNVKKVSDIVDILSTVKPNDIIFIDEIHALTKKAQEQLYFAMEQFVTDIETEDGVMRVDLPHFTIIGATTDLGGLEEPCRNRFPLHLTLESYSNEIMANIVSNIFETMGIDIYFNDAEKIGIASRGIPRVANNLCRRVYDTAMVFNKGEINTEIIKSTLKMLGVDEYGLSRNDKNYLAFLYKYTQPYAGIGTIASSIGLDAKTIENTIEPFLLQRGYIRRTMRGRILTGKGEELCKRD